MGRTVRSIIKIMSHCNNADVLKYRLGIDLDREFTDEELDSDKSILLNNLLEPHTRAETAEKFGITRERVIAIERAFFIMDVPLEGESYLIILNDVMRAF